MTAVRVNLAWMTPAQLRRLQLLWRRWMQGLRLAPARDRELRHAYVEIITRGRARTTKQLSAADAALVIRRLERTTKFRRRSVYAHVVGTAGRQGYEEHPEVAATPAAVRLLEQHAAALGMNAAELDRFIRRHYAGVGLRRRADLRTMADLNRVLWGLKALLRRRASRRRVTERKRAA